MKKILIYINLLLFIILFSKNVFSLEVCVDNIGKKYYTNSSCKSGDQKIESKKELNGDKKSYSNNSKCHSGAISNLTNGSYDKIHLNVLDFECFDRIENEIVKPKKGNIFISLLVEIYNGEDFSINGGSSDYHNTFFIISDDGYSIQGENTSIQAWKDNRQVWNTSVLKPGEKIKGWIVFQIPEKSKINKLAFKIDKEIEKNSYSEIGVLDVVF